MPHSTSPKKSPSDENDGDMLPDAPPAESEPKPQEDNGTSGNETAGVKLEDLFNDDDDDEYPTSSAPEAKAEPSSTAEGVE